MPELTTDKIAKMYTLAKRVYFKEMNVNTALDEAEKFEMERGLTNDLIVNFKYLYEGKKYIKTNNHDATEYCMQNIFNDFGKDKLLNAKNALAGHIEYYEALRGTTMYELREILQKFKEQ